MIHKLALALAMEKVAIPTPEQQMAEIASLEQKQRALMGLRGTPMPLKLQDVYDSHGNVVGQEAVEDMSSARANVRGADRREVRKFKDSAGKMHQKTHTIPGASQATTQPLLEKGTIEAQSAVANSPLKRLRHKTIGPAKRFWSGQGGLGGKWPNRLALLAGLGTLAAGAKMYSDSTPSPKPADPQLPPPQPQYADQAYGELPEYQTRYASHQPRRRGMLQLKLGGFPYVQDAANVPKPPSQPKVPSPGPSVGSATLDKGLAAGGLPKPSLGGSTGASATASASGATTSKVAMDDAMYPLIGAGVGGAGGYFLGKKVLGPVLDFQEKNLAAKAEAYTRAQKTVASAKGKAPMTAAVAGAILLAALTAVAARNKRQKSIVEGRQRIDPYDPTGAGFEQHQGAPLGGYTHPGSFYG